MVGKAHPTTMLDDLHEAAANALPPRREEEPPSLRQEILDELSDHFACAYRRELLRTQGDAELSKRNLLARFGDPAKIARRLWFDAMKGKLMTQKFMVFATCLNVVLMTLIALLVWRMVASPQPISALIAQSQETSAALLAQSEKTHAAILARLESQSKNGKTDWNGSLEWRKIEVKFVDAVTGEPVKDVRVSLNGPDGSSVYRQSLSDIQPSESGVVEISPVYIGSYSLKFSLPDGLEHQEAVTVRPGHDFRKTFRIPKMPDTGKIDFQIEWPERLQDRDIWLTIAFVNTSSLTIDNNPWWYQRPKFFAVHTDGRMVDLVSYFHDQGGKSVAVGLPGEVDDLFYQASTKYHDQPDAPTYDELVTGQVRIKALGIHTASSFPPENSQQLFLTSLHEADLAGIAIKPDMPNVWKIKIPDVVANAIPDEKLPPRTPVEAPKIPSYGGQTATKISPATVTIRCIDNSRNAVPVKGVSLALQRSSSGPVSWDSPPSKYELPLTNAEGVSRLGGIQPGTYDIAITTPAGALSLTEEFQIVPNQAIDRTIVCPRPWPRKPVMLSVNWPTIGKNRGDLWLVMEVTEKLVQHTEELGDWPTHGRYLFAVHPDGRTVSWTSDADASGPTLFDIMNWPREREARFPSTATRKHLLAWSSDSSDTPRISMFPYHSAEHRLIGVGIARWDGTGSEQLSIVVFQES